MPETYRATPGSWVTDCGRFHLTPERGGGGGRWYVLIAAEHEGLEKTLGASGILAADWPNRRRLMHDLADVCLVAGLEPPRRLSKRVACWTSADGAVLVRRYSGSRAWGFHILGLLDELAELIRPTIEYATRAEALVAAAHVRSTLLISDEREARRCGRLYRDHYASISAEYVTTSSSSRCEVAKGFVTEWIEMRRAETGTSPDDPSSGRARRGERVPAIAPPERTHNP